MVDATDFFLAIFISIIKMVEYILGFWLIPVIFFGNFQIIHEIGWIYFWVSG